VTTQNTVLIGKRVEDMLSVEVLPDLLDFTAIKLAKVSLKYEDPANGINVQKDFIFKPTEHPPVTWTVELKNRARREYQWRAQYFLAAGGPPQTTEWQTTGEPTIILEVSPAPTA